MACTSGCPAISSITSGIVSRVSPPAQSTGLLRLQRGGNLASIASRRSSGSAISSSPRSLVTASAVTTPHPPAVVSTTTFGPTGNGCVANVAAASNAASTVVARVIPAARQAPSKILSSAAKRSGVAGRRPRPTLGGTALQHDQRLAAGGAGEARHQAVSVGDPLDVGQADRRLGVVGVEVEVVGDRDGGRVAGRNGAADADTGGARQVHEARHEVPALARHRDPAGRRVRRHDLGAQLGRRRHHALTVRPGEHDPELVGERHELVFARRDPLLPPRRIRPTSGTPPAHPWRHTIEGSPDWRRQACTRTRGRPPRPGARRCRPPCAHRALPRPAGWCRRPRPAYPPASRLCRETKPNLPGCDDAPVTSTPRGENRASNCSAVGRVRGAGRSPSPPSPNSTSASTATGSPVVADDQRIHVDARDVGPLDRQSSEPDQQIDDAFTIHLGIATERPEELLRGEVVDHLGGRRAVERSGSEHDVGDRLGEDPADAEHHRRSELAIAQHAGDQLAVPGHHRRDEQRDVAVGRRARRPTARRRRRARLARRPAGGARGHVRSCGRSRRRTASQPPESRSRTRPRPPRRRSPRRARRRTAARIRPGVASKRPPTSVVEGVVIARNGSEPRSPGTGTAAERQRVRASGRLGRTPARGRGAGRVSRVRASGRPAGRR